MESFKYIALTIIYYTLAQSQEIEYYASKSIVNNLKEKLERSTSFNQHKLPNNRFDKSNRGKYLQNRNISIRRYYPELKNKLNTEDRIKRATDPVFYGHPKTIEEMWHENFIKKNNAFDQTPSLITLIHNITVTYLNDCTPVLLYDNKVRSQDSYLFQDLLKDFPVTYVHGYINDNNQLKEPNLLLNVKECLHFILFLTDVTLAAKILGKRSENKILVVARSSQWAVQEFLSNALSRMFINLLVIGQSFKDDEDETREAPYILYTHELYIDGLGASKPVVLNSWTHGKFSRHVNLFPKKMMKGYAGHRFLVAAANQPPYVFRRIKTDVDGGNPRVVWDGIEIRVLNLLAEKNNFSIEIVEPREPHLGPGDAVSREITMSRADIALGGMYLTYERTRDMDMAFSHSHDCAAFITLMSTALPRYRAILGPFHWHVWVALTFTYLIGIFPLAFSDKHTLRHLVHNSGEVENMFWYVFGTFTNCFTFVGKNSWSKTTKVTTRLLIGWYWIFTIIITSCYTGCIIAFVTLPVFPETIDTIDQLLSGFYRVGTLDRGGWEKWFSNSSDPKTNKLFRKIELVPNVESGIRNTTKAFFWPYAFLGSRAQLEYIVQANFTKTSSKRSVLHISNECFVPFGVSIGFPNNSLYSQKFNDGLRRIYQNGIVDKITSDVRWEMQRSSTGKLLSAGSGSLTITSAEEKGLTLEDTQGMFLLLAAGFLLAAAALMSEWMGGITRYCRLRRKPEGTNSQEKLITTPKSDIKTEENIVYDADCDKLNIDPRPYSAESRNTLDGQIINVTQESITVHENFDVEKFDSRRSSSVDLDKEVREIFEKDMKRRIIVRGDTIELMDDSREPTASKGAFGDRVK
ncbi:ionotropic receptor 21a [Achroia grisella]|uniref:ionotropic receptor 21a n=1 Tax=Achroia grisella TaxID=688607 RepID=UPI0027D2B9D4|nr:ionotropic receptor 21a [Achroia grisella]